MKNVLLFGATGRTGTLNIDYALKKGCTVTALVRNPEKIKLRSPRLVEVKGLPTNAEDVRKAVKECDVVISTLSALSEKDNFSFRKIKAPHVLESAIMNAIESMKAYQVKRIIALSPIGVGDSFALAPRYMRFMIRITNFKIIFADDARKEA